MTKEGVAKGTLLDWRRKIKMHMKKKISQLRI